MGNKDLKSYGGDKDGEEENVTSSMPRQLIEDEGEGNGGKERKREGLSIRCLRRVLRKMRCKD